MNLQTKLNQARATDRLRGRAQFGTANVEVISSGPDDARPLTAPSSGEVETLRAGLAAHRAGLPLERTPAPLLDVARRMRNEYLSSDPNGYAMVRTADLDLILAFVEERA